MGHGVLDCEELSQEEKAKGEDSFPYSSALRAESKLLGRECFQFGFASRSPRVQRNYTGPPNTSVEDQNLVAAADFCETQRNDVPVIGRIWKLVKRKETWGISG